MIEKYSFGQNIETDAVVNKMRSLPCAQLNLGKVKSDWPFEWEYELEKDAVVFGLGENMRGMNKRGFSYTSFCSDVPNQDESTHSMYGAHNFLIVFSRIKTFGLFFDTASEITFDIDWTKSGVMNVSTKDTGLDLYVIYADDGRKESLLDNITRQFRNLVEWRCEVSSECLLISQRLTAMQKASHDCVLPVFVLRWEQLL
ncbi:MAG: hypothetical protein II077_11645, partial [Treponema sp.]|nr:hypothetical protein [Treponema sp.]